MAEAYPIHQVLLESDAEARIALHRQCLLAIYTLEKAGVAQDGVLAALYRNLASAPNDWTEREVKEGAG